MASAFHEDPIVGKPGGIGSKFLRVDYRPGTVFDSLIETKTARIAWARATICPCRGFNSKTEQLDPGCPSCNGLGWAYFRPAKYVVDPDTLGVLSDEQKAVVEKANAVVVRGAMSSLETDPDMFRALGNWVFGSARLTLRGENKPGYYDRVISIDESAVYSEVIASGGPTLRTKYPVVSLNRLATLTTAFTDKDVELVAGVITWKAGKEPASGTLITANYNCHPVWVVQSHVHVIRSSLAEFKMPKSKLQTPMGNLLILPVQVLVRLEHLSGDPG